MSDNSNLVQELINKVKDRFLGASNYYNYSLLPNIQEYADSVNMTPYERNDFQHIAGSAQSAFDMGKPLSVIGGLGKELHDLKYGDGWKDTITDWNNNKKGWKIHKQHPNLQDDQLYDYVYNNYIKPNRK